VLFITSTGWAGKRRSLGFIGMAKFALAAPLLWLAFMSCLPHKEERFMYCVYPLLCVAGAVCLTAFDDMVQWWIAAQEKRAFFCAPHHIQNLIRFGRAILIALIIALSVSRSVATVLGFRAPLQLYSHLYNVELPRVTDGTTGEVSVCVGKEWHRFPSWFFLRPRSALAFVHSGFTGQLPQRFSFKYGTWAPPPGFNSKNQEEPDRYVDSAQCHYFVDLEAEGKVDPRFAAPHWSKVFSAPFLDLEHSPQLTRAFYIPLLSQRFNRYVSYTLRRNTAGIGGLADVNKEASPKLKSKTHRDT